MAGRIASFMSGGLLVIRINRVQFAYCQSLSFNQTVTVTPVFGVGSMGASALEPTAFAASGTLRVLRWDSRLAKAIKAQATAQNGKAVPPHNLKAGVENEFAQYSGNSFLDSLAFNPLGLILSSTFDIDVYERGGNQTLTKDADGIISVSDAGIVPGADGNLPDPLFKFIDCRFTDYSFDFAPGQLLFENLNYVCAQIQEKF